MDDDTKKALEAILTRIDLLSAQMAKIELNFSTAMIKSTSDISQLQRESSQLFTFYNSDFAKLKEEVRDNRHAIKNLETNYATVYQELEDLDKLKSSEIFDLQRQLNQAQHRYDNLFAEEEGKKKLWRVIHGVILFVIVVVTFYNSNIPRP